MNLRQSIPSDRTCLRRQSPHSSGPGKRTALLILLLPGLIALTAPTPLHAQPCPQFPAACPDLRADPGSAEDSITRLEDPVLPCEIAMENRLRHWTAALVDAIARKEGWEVTEIYEALGSGYRDNDNSLLPYDKRPAHWSRMIWQFIVDKDSLQAWRSWLLDYSQRRLAQARQNAAQPAGTESAAQKLRFSDASTVIIEFDFNGDLAAVAGAGRAAPSGSPPGTRWYHISQPDLLDNVNYYTHSHNMALWTFGGWNPLPGQVGGYAASRTADRSNQKGVTIKKIKCDMLQNFYVRVSGNAAAMRRILADLPAGGLEKMIAPQ